MTDSCTQPLAPANIKNIKVLIGLYCKDEVYLEHPLQLLQLPLTEVCPGPPSLVLLALGVYRHISQDPLRIERPRRAAQEIRNCLLFCGLSEQSS